MIDLGRITMLNDLKERLLAVTDEQIQYAAERLGPVGKKETAIGVVGEEVRALWALSVVLLSEVSLQKALASALVNPQLTVEHMQRGIMIDQLDDIVQELMWAQARSDAGFWEPMDIGIREGWQFVQYTREDPMAMLKKLGIMPQMPE